MPLPLIAIAIVAFGIGTTEFVIMGWLIDVARDLRVSIPAAGMLVSGYALGVTMALGALGLAAWNNLERRAPACVTPS
ncbi:MFS transporter, DHA1 family, inner membrane transport protein [Burkholderia sp. b13]|nr:MFS transporter, DHA1 family, inner membrane transport protein [Burkholderia sp. b13]